MKQLMAMATLLLSTCFVYGQDMIKLRTGEVITAKVAEVGVSEIKYYKTSNIDGPLYVAAKTSVSQIVFQNGTTDVFTATASTPVVMPLTPRIVVIEQPYPTVYRRSGSWTRGWRYPVINTHIDLGHRASRHHGRHH